MPLKNTLLLTCAALALFVRIGNAQTVNGKPVAEIDAEYVEVSATGKLLSSAVTIDIDFGQLDTGFERKDTEIRDENNRAIVFKSTVDALNFMHKLGYEVIQVYVVPVNGGTSCYYLMKRNRRLIE
jgi:hypothetical protein